MNWPDIYAKFKELFDGNPLMVRSPGRINLIGEHTDYNDGFVFPAAIDKEIVFAAAKNDKGLFRFYAKDLDASFELPVADLHVTGTAWANYLLGVVAQYQKRGYQISGIDCVFGGDIPVGAGMSSSAAIENGFAMAIKHLFNINVGKLEMIKMAQMAEHEYAGVLCGIMDQFASMQGRQSHAIKLDCRSLDFEYANIDMEHYAFVLCDTGVKHELASSEYNKRKSECEAGVRLLQKYNDGIKALRDVSLELIAAHRDEFDPVVLKRCSYVVSENMRVEQAFKALHQNDMETFGELMFASHRGLQHDYEVSCKELDFMVDLAKETTGVLGSRMMGGGFGGCTINLIRKEAIGEFEKTLKFAYKKFTGKEPEIYKVSIVNGTEVIEIKD